MIAFSVVVLPAPLRPSRVTTSPRRTSKLTPCSTWLSPYQPLQVAHGEHRRGVGRRGRGRPQAWPTPM